MRMVEVNPPDMSFARTSTPAGLRTSTIIRKSMLTRGITTITVLATTRMARKNSDLIPIRSR